MNPTVCALILAAGRSERFGGGDNKCFAPVAGQTVLWHSYAAFLELPEISGIVVAVAENEVSMAEDALSGLLDSRFFGFCKGGSTRQASVIAGLSYLSRAADRDSVVLVHDAARCLVTQAAIQATLDTVIRERAGAAPAIPVVDTIRQIDSAGHVTACLERDSLRAMQTPQGARLDILLEAYSCAADMGLSVTDDLSALEAVGYPVRLVSGDLQNIKLTAAGDLDLADRWLQARIDRQNGGLYR